MADSRQDLPTADPSRSTILQAATIIGIAFVFSRLLGLVRDAVITNLYGIDTLEANAYFIANRFPETIFLIIAGGALGSAFIPVFSAYFARNEHRQGWWLFSVIVNLVVIVTTIVAGLAAIFAPQIISFFYSTLIAKDPALLDLSVDMMRLMLISPVIFGVSGIIMSALNARQHFLLPAVAPIIYNLGIIAGAIAFAPNALGLAIGTVVGSFGHLIIQLPGLRKKRAEYSLALSVRDRGVIQVLRLMTPRVLGLSFGQFNHLLMQFLAESMVVGSIPALGLAWRIMIMPHAIIGQALAIAAFPTFSTLAAKAARDTMRQIVVDTIRLIFFLSLPAAMLLMVLREPLIAFLFQRGRFDQEATGIVGMALLFFALSLVSLAAIEIVSRAFYALEDTLTPVLVGLVQLIVMGLLGAWLGYNIFPDSGMLGLGGLALGYTISTLLELLLLLYLLQRKMDGLQGRRILNGLWRMIVATLLMGSGSLLLREWLPETSLILQLLIIGSAAAGVYIFAAKVLGIDELNQLIGLVRKRIKS